MTVRRLVPILNHMVYYSPDSARLDATFGALSDATRRSILEHLAKGERTIGELAAGYEMSLPAVSKHIRVLQRAGLAEIERDGRVRRCTLVAEPMRAASEWITRYREYWEESFDRLARYLDETLDEEHGDG